CLRRCQKFCARFMLGLCTIPARGGTGRTACGHKAECASCRCLSETETRFRGERAMKQPDYPHAGVEELRRQVAYAERAKQVMDRIHAATDLDQIFVELLDDILGLFDAEHLTLYAVDYDKREIYSRFLDLDEIKEIRVPFNEQSVVGFVARNRKAVNVADAYDAAELSRLGAALAFDRSWDQRTGVRTRQM